MTSPRTPRQWGPGNSEPDLDLTLADLDGDLITYNREEDGDWSVGWRYVRVDGCAVSLPGVPWSDFDDEFDVSWPLSEVLPETPDEPPCVDDCCSATGPARLAAELSRVIHEFAEDLPWPDSQRLGADAARAVWAAGSNAAIPASQPVPAVPVSSTGGKEAREAAEAGAEALSPVPYAEHERIVAEEVDRRDEAEEWADKLAAALAPPHIVGGHSLKNHPWRNALEWAQENRPSSPLPDSETEWGWQPDPQMPQGVITAHDEQAARNRASAHHERKLMRREVGPWIEVTS